MANPSHPTGDAPLQLKKFNSTGSQTTTEVIATKLSAADQLRRAALIGAVIVAFGILGVIAFRTSGLNPFEQPKQGPGFEAPQHTQAPQ